MRAIYLKEMDLADKEVLISEKSSLHHLSNVIRIKINDELLLLNGLGLKSFGRITSISKKEIKIIIEKTEQENKSFNIDLYVGLVKKDALSELVKKAVEVGISEIYPLQSEYSQSYSFNTERMEKLISSSIEQSNNPFGLKINKIKKFSDIKDLLADYDKSFYFSSIKNDLTNLSIDFSANDKIALIIGPEGGFSLEEEKILYSCATTSINLPTPIMRTPTAICVGMGHIISKF